MRSRRLRTALELAAALAVVTLLAGVLTPTLGRAIEESRRARAAADCRAICDALLAYRRDHGEYPPGLQGDPTYNYGQGARDGFGAEVLNPWLFDAGPRYLERRIGKDPWGGSYNYQVFTRSAPFVEVVVFSDGPDRSCASWDTALWNAARFAGDDVGAIAAPSH